MVGVFEVQYVFSKLLVLIENNIHFFISILFFEKSTKDKKDVVYISDINGREQTNNQAERILIEYGNSILRLAYSYLHNMSDAEDVLQDTLIQYIKTAPLFEGHLMRKHGLFVSLLTLVKIKSNIIKFVERMN